MDAGKKSIETQLHEALVAKEQLEHRLSVLESKVEKLEARVLGNATTGFESVTLSIVSSRHVPGRGFVTEVVFVGEPAKLYPGDVLATTKGEWRIASIENLVRANPANPAAKIPARTLTLTLEELKPGTLAQGEALRKVRGLA